MLGILTTKDLNKKDGEEKIDIKYVKIYLSYSEK